MLEVMDRRILKSQDKEKILVLNNWNHTDYFCMIVIGGITLSHIRHHCSHVPDGIFFEFEEQIVLIKRVKMTRGILKKDFSLPKISGAVIGISYPFCDLSSYEVFYQQAKDAYQYGKDNRQSIVWFSDCALRVMMNHASDYLKSSVHPAVITLKKYDLDNHTELANTLRVFLQSERSFIHAAKELHVHRNTILYRLKKIEELVELDMENPEEREYLLLSFRLG